MAQDACDDYYYHILTFHENTVWRDSCGSWYKKNGQVRIWPGAVSVGIPRPVYIDSCIPVAEYPLPENFERRTATNTIE